MYDTKIIAVLVDYGKCFHFSVQWPFFFLRSYGPTPKAITRLLAQTHEDMATKEISDGN